MVATLLITKMPGVFGFLVWELKENWKLYRANRATNLRPVMIGHHGETMLRLLRPGFHSGTLPKLFAKFTRIDAAHSSRRAMGTGLGLYICRELVRRMDGKIWVESKLGEGSTFVVELPAATG